MSKSKILRGLGAMRCFELLARYFYFDTFGHNQSSCIIYNQAHSCFQEVNMPVSQNDMITDINKRQLEKQNKRGCKGEKAARC